jgi:hypothetical protein
MSAFSPFEDRSEPSFSPNENRIADEVLTRHKVLLVALRILNTSCIESKPPSQADEAYLRQIARDETTPIDDLAGRVIQSEVRLLKKGGERWGKTNSEP